MSKVPQHLPCVRCGECCRHGGECIFRGWGPDPLPVEFDGVCQFLGSDPQHTCSRVAQAFEDQPKSMGRFIRGICDWPAQFVRYHDSITYNKIKQQAEAAGLWERPDETG